MTLITRQKVLAIKAEDTPGTAETLANANGVMNCYDTEWVPDLPTMDRPSQGTYDAPLNSIQTTRAGNVRFRTDLLGGSSAPYWFTHVLTQCGFSVSSLTASANGSSNTSTSTVAMYQDGLRKQIAGAMGTFTMPFVVGEPLMGEFDFRGKYSSVSDQTLLTPTYLTTDPPRVASATITYDSDQLYFKTGTLTVENSLKLRDDDSDVTGFEKCLITQQTITIELDAEADLVANRDDYANLLANNVGTFTMTVGTSGNQLVFTVPNCQITGLGDGDRDGILTHNLTLLHTGSTAMTIVSA